MCSRSVGLSDRARRSIGGGRPRAATRSFHPQFRIAAELLGRHRVGENGVTSATAGVTPCVRCSIYAFLTPLRLERSEFVQGPKAGKTLQSTGPQGLPRFVSHHAVSGLGEPNPVNGASKAVEAGTISRAFAVHRGRGGTTLWNVPCIA